MKRLDAPRGRIVVLALVLALVCAGGAAALGASPVRADTAALPAPAPSATWATVSAAPGGMKTATAAAIARDAASGALYVAASAGATVDRPARLVLIKYDATGNVIWKTPFAPPSARQTGAVDVAFDHGGVYVLGWTKTASRGRDWLVAKFTTGGSFVWGSRLAGAGASNDVPNDLLLTPSGRVWACGSLGRSGHGLDAALVRFAATTGKVLARRIVDDPAHRADAFNDLGVDRAGRLFAAGKYGRPVGSDGLLASYSSTGTRLWVRTWGSKGRLDDPVNGLVVGPTGKAYVVGALGAPGGSKALIRQYNAAGRFIWQGTFRTESAGGTASFSAAVLLPDGRVVATGTFTGANRNPNIVTVAFAPKGPSLWNQTYDTPFKSKPSNDVARGIAADKDGDVFVAATVPFLRDGGSRIAVLRYSANGAQGWLAPAWWDDGAKDSEAADIVLAPQRVIVTGRTARGGKTDVATVAFPY